MPTMTKSSRRKYTRYLLDDADARFEAGLITEDELFDYWFRVVRYSPRELFVAYCGAVEENALAADKEVANG